MPGRSLSKPLLAFILTCALVAVFSLLAWRYAPSWIALTATFSGIVMLIIVFLLARSTFRIPAPAPRSAPEQIESALRANEEFLRGMYNITSSSQLPFKEKLQSLLVLATQHFDMQASLMLRHYDAGDVISESYSTTSDRTFGKSLRAVGILAAEVLQQGRLYVVSDTAQDDSPIAQVCRAAGVTAFVSAPIYSSGRTYGVLALLAFDQRPRSYQPSQMEFIRLMSQWMGGELEREEYVLQLQRYTSIIAQVNQNLAQARDEALAAAEFKTEFLATMSHEIRTPLNAVVGMAELLAGTPLNPEQADYAGVIQDSAQVLLTLINDILDLSKIEAGKVVLESYEFSPREIIEGAVDLFQARAQEKDLTLMSFVSPDIPARVNGDGVRLRQVLMNLISNAIKFTTQGHVFVQVTLEKESSEQVRLQFEVQDTGIGLSSDARRHLFQPFTQADESTARKYGGTGLGLAISQRLVRLMNGEIGVESMVNEGSTFWASIPFTRSTTPQAAHPELAGRRVLLFASESFHRTVLLRILNAVAVDVVTASDLIDGLRLLTQAVSAETPFDAVLIDADLQAMPALELADSISRQDEAASIPRILLAFRNAWSDMALDSIGRFAAVLTRPVKQSQLYIALANLVHGLPLEPVVAASGLAELWPVEDSLLPENLVQELINPRPVVLLAEDNPSNQRLSSIQLRKLGVDTEIAPNGSEALRLVSQNPDRYTLIFMDCQMPEMDGYQATAAIRHSEDGGERHIPIIAMTASATSADRDACLAAGMDDYLSKPIRMAELRKVLTRWIKSVDDSNEPIDTESAPLLEGGKIDRETLANIRKLQTEGEPDFLTELIDLYLVEAHSRLEAVRAAVQACDEDLLKRSAHALKGASLNLGARTVAEICSRMETLAQQGSFDEAARLFNTLAQEEAAACRELSAERVN